jgi:S-DNA-T family DNA segregation ATPase FtsK/SpoIIIE
LFGSLRSEIKQEILGVLLVAGAILIYVGLFSTSNTGAGQFVRLAFTAAFGRAQLAMPAVAGVAGLLCIFQRGHLMAGARAVGWALGIVVALGWLHCLVPGIVGAEFQNATIGVGGGIVGAAVTWGLRQVVGPLGRDVALAALSLVAVVLATDLSLVSLSRGLGQGLSAAGRRLGRAFVAFTGFFRKARPSPVRSGAREYEARGYANLGPGQVTAARERLSNPGRPATQVGGTPGRVSLGAGTLIGTGSPPSPGGPRAGLTTLGRGSGADVIAGGASGAGVVGTGGGTGLARAGGAGPGVLSDVAVSLSGSLAGAPGRMTGDRRKPYEQIALTEDYLYELPPLSILDLPIPAKGRRTKQDLEDKARVLEETLASFGVGGKVIEARRGPVVTRFEFQPAPGVKVARITSLADDIALHLASQGVRIEAPIPGKHAVGIEVPNLEVSSVPLREVLEDPEVVAKPSKLTVVFGKEITGRPITGDLDRLLHVLIAGATGSGKSVCINAILASLLFRAKPSEVKLLLIDPKVVELSVYEGIPHLVAPVVTDPKKAAGCLRWAVKQMEERYELFAAAGVRDITRYNAQVAEMRTSAGAAGATPRVVAAPGVATVPTVTVAGTAVGQLEGETARQIRAGAGPQPLPYIVIVIDELGDLMMVAPVDVEDAIWRLAQMARAAGIHLLVATQRPTVDVITGTIKANIPTRVAFAVASQIDSRTIIDGPGAEKLLGHGDMLFLPVGLTKPIRVQGAYVSDREIEALVAYVKSQGRPKYAPDVLQTEDTGRDEPEPANDTLFEDAVRVVMETGQASISMIQRKLRVGYTRAGRLIDMMEEKGLVGPFEGSKAREIMMTFDQYRRQKEAAKRAVEQSLSRTAPGPPAGASGLPISRRAGQDEQGQ